MLTLSAGSPLVDGYVITQVLDAQEAALCFQVRDQNGQHFSAKVLPEEYAAHREAIARFERAAELSLALKSPHLIAGIQTGKLADQRPYLILEEAPGISVKEYIAQRRLSPAEAAQLVIQACYGLEPIHRAQVIHRNISARNLLINPETRQVKLAGLSAVRLPSSKLTRRRQALGTPSYMAPEQIRNSTQVDNRADIWSLGVLLHELACQTLPFEGENLTALVLSIMNDAPSMSAGLPKELSSIITRCLEKEPQKRYASVSQLLSSLQRFQPMPAQQGHISPPNQLVATERNPSSYFHEKSPQPAPPQQVIPPLPQVSRGPALGAPLTSSPPPNQAFFVSASRPGNAAIPAEPARYEPVQPSGGAEARSPGVSAIPPMPTPVAGWQPAQAQKPATAAAQFIPAPVAAPAPSILAAPPAQAAPQQPNMSLERFAAICGELAVFPPHQKPELLAKHGLSEEQRLYWMNYFRNYLEANPTEHARWRHSYDSAVAHFRKTSLGGA